MTQSTLSLPLALGPRLPRLPALPSIAQPKLTLRATLMWPNVGVRVQVTDQDLDINPEVGVQYSTDGGTTWRPDPAPLVEIDAERSIRFVVCLLKLAIEKARQRLKLPEPLHAYVADLEPQALVYLPIPLPPAPGGLPLPPLISAGALPQITLDATLKWQSGLEVRVVLTDQDRDLNPEVQGSYRTTSTAAWTVSPTVEVPVKETIRLVVSLLWMIARAAAGAAGIPLPPLPASIPLWPVVAAIQES